MAVAVIKAVATARGLHLSRQEIAELACHIEIGKLQMPIGRQDQYAAAFGGLNFITFRRGEVTVEPLRMAPELLARLERRLMLFYTGASRNSSSILGEQSQASSRDDATVIQALNHVKEMALEGARPPGARRRRRHGPDVAPQLAGEEKVRLSRQQFADRRLRYSSGPGSRRRGRQDHRRRRRRLSLALL